MIINKINNDNKQIIIIISNRVINQINYSNYFQKSGKISTVVTTKMISDHLKMFHIGTTYGEINLEE